ncbi:MAG: DUF2914 domain-containing protein [Deltaproteobacteria bacterium]|nr:DUF2914 domain-containing protein [Deltaproteobacteria bacterium]MBK8239391.1 DUF2914 domain-containing protein [Deltaproteobacteria bacterium]MBK8720264.1 DUF2914 domain-containing protein [Deltaproteobacteria bacterium]MBP7287634.1 DUF2914 domain-containing protein [Nannocystaceae bacterium]
MAEPRGKRVLAWVQRVLPWASLAVGIVGALMMDRGPARGAIVAGVALASWFVLMLVMWLERIHEARVAAHQGDPAETAPGVRIVRGARFSTLMLVQSSIHLQLYFALPFYFSAFAGTLAQSAFMALLCLAALASLWDPLTEWLLVHTRMGLLLPAFASFAVMAAVLPGLGLSNTAALWAATGAGALALPVLVFADRVRGRRLATTIVLAVVVAAVLPVALLLGAARLVPAVPMKLVTAAVGTRRAGYEVVDATDRLARVPARLVCATAIFAPLGVRERLWHVWRHDGLVVDRILLEIRGGREDGFRTYSVKQNFGDAPAGHWSCAVETSLGQFLGERTLVIEPAS